MLSRAIIAAMPAMPAAPPDIGNAIIIGLGIAIGVSVVAAIIAAIIFSRRRP